ncbi:MAG: hypothetical protein IPG59_13635 [Candidatus Melainabacteria bacterium]|nr:MAG: hypothetical protein IPG59_13635 [Candidatus Melainabacteria bacterium]
MISIGPSNTFKKWAFGLTGLFITGAGSVGSAGLLLYCLGSASPEDLTVNPTSDASIASTIVSAICASLAMISILTCISDPKLFRISSWILGAIASCGAVGFFMLGYIAWPIAIAVAIVLNVIVARSVNR